MTARSLALLLSDLGVTKSHARPHVPDDNPYSEAQFKTMKYRLIIPTGLAVSKMSEVGHAASFRGITLSIITRDWD